MEGGWRKVPPAANVSRFADLYRSACADLALADAYQLPPATIQYLHQLVGRAHNQLYRHESLHTDGWFRELFVNVPQRLFADGCLRLAFAHLLGRLPAVRVHCLARSRLCPADRRQGGLLSIERQYSATTMPQADERAAMAGFYIRHNATIGLRCFAFGLLAGVGGLYETVFNASTLGAEFGYMVALAQRGQLLSFRHRPRSLRVDGGRAHGRRGDAARFFHDRHPRTQPGRRRLPRRAAERARDVGRRGPLSAGGRDRGLCIALRRALRRESGRRRFVDRHARCSISLSSGTRAARRCMMLDQSSDRDPRARLPGTAGPRPARAAEPGGAAFRGAAGRDRAAGRAQRLAAQPRRGGSAQTADRRGCF